MPGIFPDTQNGGVIIRDDAGVCSVPENVQGAFCPPATFTSDCLLTALPSECAARITPAQINALVSELLCLAYTLDPNGNWDCDSLCNLSAAFAAWAGGTLDDFALRDLSNTTGPRGKITPTSAAGTNYDTLLENGFWHMPAGRPNAPEATRSYVVNVQTSNDPAQYVTQYAYAYADDGVNDSLKFKRERNAGVWGAWYRVYETGSEIVSLINSDAWALQPIGAVIAVQTDIVGIAVPPNNLATYRYIELTAGKTGAGQYNNGSLGSESVSGSAPLILATASVTLAGSPIVGQTVRLINSERRFLRAGSAGTLEDSQNIAHIHGITDPQHRHVATWIDGNVFTINSGGAARRLPFTSDGGAGFVDTTLSATGITIQSNGGTEARSRNMGTTYFMRIK